jgi:hypothetical protein
VVRTDMATYRASVFEESEYSRPASETRLIYSNRRYASIARVVGVPVSAVKARAHEFEVAALLYQHDCSDVVLAKPTKGRRRLQQIAGAAKRLLKTLGVQDADDAPDGPSSEVLDLLRYADTVGEDRITHATERVGRLAEVFEGISAARSLKQASEEAASGVICVGNLIVPKGHQAGPLSVWVAALFGIHKRLTGREPATSVGAPARSNEGKAGGPLIRFLQTTGRPLGIRKSDEAWRSIVRGILVHGQN